MTIRRPIPVAAQIAVLSLGVSAMPFLVRADEASLNDAWVWGVAAREAAVAQAYAPVFDTLAARERKPKTPPVPPAPLRHPRRRLLRQAAAVAVSAPRPCRRAPAF